MVAKNGTEITDFSNPNDTNQYDHDSVEDCFDFLKQRSQFNINGYGVAYVLNQKFEGLNIEMNNINNNTNSSVLDNLISAEI